MATTGAFIKLSEYKSLFKDEAAYNELIQSLESKTDDKSIHLVLSDDRVLFTAVSPDCMKDVLCDRLAGRIAQTPNLFDELRRRIDEDEIVD